MGMKTFFVLALVAGINAGPLNYRSSKCAETCIDTNKFNYEQGKTYTFVYNSGVVTKVNGASEDVSGLHIRATADFEVLDSCNYVLRLRDVQLEESDPRDENRRITSPSNYQFKSALEGRPLRFSFQDGRIDAVCPDTDEPKWVTNIKRSVLSAFQNSMDDFKTDMRSGESDVTGTCQTEYKVKENSWNTFTLEKKKDLLSCSERDSARTAFQSAPYRVPSAFQSLPLTKSDHKCTSIHFKNGNLKHVECNEEHVFRPFAKHNKGAMTTAKHSLEYSTERSGVSTQVMGNTRKSNLIFEHEEQKNADSSIDKAKAVLQEICSEVSHDVRPSTAKLFSRLVYTLKTLPNRDLSRVQAMVASGGICQNNQQKVERFFHDALPMLGTPASIEVMSDLMIRDHVTKSEAKVWLTSLAFVQKPSIEMIKSLERLIERKPTGNALLSASALINAYCKTVKDCENDPTVQRIADVLLRKLNSDCRSSTGEERIAIIMTLKALGNLGFAPKSARYLQACVSNTENPMDVRLAAVDAFRRQPCHSTDRSTLKQIFTRTDEDSELRIAAYLALMQCPTTETMDIIKSTLETEEVNQVGSFIWTHLTNILESTDVHKQNIRRILDDSLLKKTFDMDKRKFSRNFEKSMFAKAINTGAKVDGNLIWSQNSFVPRSALVNVTVDLFGHSMNLLEIGGRVEGLDRLLETYFGPKGYNPESKTSPRSKRSINEITRVVDRFAQSRPVQDALKGSMFVRVFGHEVSYMDMSQHGENSFNILEMLIKLAQQHDVDYTKSFMFLDTSFALPTIAGFPLRLSINGTATINMKVKGKLDIRKLGASPRSVDIDGSITPSGAIELDTLMSVDANVARTGLKMVTTLHSSTTLDGKITLKDSEDMVVDLKMARNKLEILNMKTQFFILHRESEREQSMLARNPTVIRKCTGEYLKKGLGLQICGQVSYPTLNAKNAPIFPLSGPASFSLELEKIDSHTGYVFEAKTIVRKNRINGRNLYNYVGRLAFDTPGSTTNRRMAIDLNASQMNKAITYTVTTPWKSLDARASMVDSDDLKRFTMSCNIDGVSEYSLSTEVQVEQMGEKTKYTPSLNIRIPRMKEIMVTGAMEYEPDKTYFATLTIQNIPKIELQSRFPYYRVNSELRPISLEGTLSKDAHRYSGNMRLRSEIYNTKTEGFIDFKQNGYKARISHDYGVNRKPEHNININSKYRFRQTESLDDRNLDLEVRLTQMPELNFRTHFIMQKTESQTELSIDHQYGSNFNDERRRIQSVAFIKYNVYRTDYQRLPSIKSTYRFTTSWPKHDIDLSVTGKHNHDKSHIENEFKLISNSKQIIETRFMLADKSRTEKDFEGEVTVDWKGEKCFDTNVKYSTEGEKHLVDAELQFPFVEKITINAAIQPNPVDFLGSTTVRYGPRSYSTSVGYKLSASTHKVDANINIQDVAPIVIAFELTPNLRDFNSKTRLTVGNDVFKGEFKYKYQMVYVKTVADTELILDLAETRYNNRRQVHVIGNLNLIPNQRHNMNFEIKNMGKSIGRFDCVIVPLSQEATITGNLAMIVMGQRRTIGLNIKQTREQIEGKVQLVWSPSWTINLVTSGNLRQTSGGAQLNGQVSLESPIPGYETMKGKITHQHGGNFLSTKTEISWNDNKMAADIIFNANDWKNIQMGATISSPFENLRKMKFHLQNTIGDRRFVTKSTVEWPGTDFNFELSGHYDNGVGGTLKIRCPRYVENLDMKFSHIARGKQYTEHGEFTWGSSAYITDLTIMETSLQNFRITINVQTPHLGYRRSSGVIALSLSGEGINMVLDGTLEGREVKLTTILNKKPVPEIKVEIKTPIEGFKDLGFVGKIDFSRSHVITLRTFWNDKDAELKIEINNQPSSEGFSNTGIITIKSPFDLLRQFKNTWTVSFQRRQLRSKIDVELNNNAYTLTVNGDSSWNRFNGDINVKGATLPTLYFDISGKAENLYDIDFSMNTNLVTLAMHLDEMELKYRMKTRCSRAPFTGSQYVELSVKNRGKNLIWDSSFDGREDNARAAMKITTPIPGFELMETNLVLSYPEGRFSGELSGKFRDLTGNVILSLNAAGLTQYEGSLKINTPFNIMKQMEYTVTHKYMQYGGFEHQQRFTHNIAGNSNMNLNVNNDNMRFTYSLNTPFPMLSALSLTLAHRGTIPHCTTTFDINMTTFDLATQGSGTMTWNGWTNGKGSMLVKDRRETAVVKGAFELGDKMMMKLNVKTPSILLSSLDFEVEQTGSLGNNYNHKVIMYYDVTYSRVDLKHHFNMEDWINFNFDFDLMSPIKHAEYLHMRFAQKEEPRGTFSTSLVMEPRPRKTISFNNKFMLGRSRFTEKLDIATPYRILEQFSFEMNQNGLAEEFTNNVKVLYNNDQVVIGNIEYVHMEKIIANVKAAAHQVDVKVNRGETSAVADVKVLYNNEEAFKLDAKFETPDGLSMKYNILMKSWFSHLRELSIGYTLKLVNPGEYSYVRDLTYVGDYVTLSANDIFTYSASRNSVTGSTTIKCSKWPSDLRSTYDFVMHKLYPRVKYTIDYYLIGKYEIDASLDMILKNRGNVNRKIDAKFDLKMPLRNWEHTKTEFYYTDDSAGNYVKVEVQNRQMTHSVALRWNPPSNGNYEATGTIKTPYPGYEECNLIISHVRKGWMMYETTANLKMGNKFAKGTFMLTAPNPATVRTSFELETSYPEISKAGFSYIHGISNPYIVKVETHYNDKKISLHGTVSTYPRMSGKVELRTPFPEVQNFILEGDLMLSRKPRGSLKCTFNNREAGILTFEHQGGLLDFNTEVKGRVMHNTAQFTAMYKHKMNAAMTFKSSLPSIGNVDFTMLRNINFNMRRSTMPGYDRAYETTMSWAEGKTIRITTGASGSYREDAGRLKLHLNMVTPFRIIRDLSVKVDHSHQFWSLLNSNFETVHNGHECVGLGVNLRRSGQTASGKAFVIVPSFTTTRRFDMTFSGSRSDNRVTGNWVAKFGSGSWSEQCELNLVYTDDSRSRYSTKNGLTVKFILPSRTMGFTSEYNKNRQETKNTVELIFDEKNQQKFGYTYIHNIAQTRSSESRSHGELIISTPIRSGKFVFDRHLNNQRCADEVTLFWDLVRDQSRQVKLTKIYESTDNTKILTLSFGHPRLEKEISVRGEVRRNIGDVLISSRLDLEYSPDARDKLSIVTSIMNPSANYSLNVDVSHPRTNIELKLKTHVASVRGRHSAGCYVKWLTASRTRNMVFLFSEVNSNAKTAYLNIISPKQHIAIAGAMKNTYGGQKFTLTNQYNEGRTLYSEFIMKPAEHLYTLTSGYDLSNSNNKLICEAMLDQKKEAKVECYRMHNNERIQEGIASVKLSSSHLITLNLKWRPEIAEEIEETILAKQQILASKIRSSTDGATAIIRNEVMQRYALLKRSLPQLPSLESEKDSFAQDWQSVQRTMYQLREENIFYCNDIFNWLDGATAHFRNIAVKMYYRMLTRLSTVQRQISVGFAYSRRAISQWMNTVQDTIANLVLKFRPAWQSYAYAVMRFYEKGVQGYRHHYERLMEHFDGYLEDAVEYLDEKFDFLSYKMKPYWIKLQKLRMDLRQKLKSTPEESYYDTLKEGIREYWSEVADFMTAYIDPIMEKLEGVIEKIETVIDMVMEKVMGHEYTQIVIEYAKKAWTKVVEHWKSMNVEENLKKIGKMVLKWVRAAIQEKLSTLISAFLRLDKSGFTVWNPEQGQIQFVLYLPTQMQDLTKWPAFNWDSLKQEANRMYKDMFPETDYSFWDTYYKYIPSSDVSDWVPPFKAYAMVADGTFFRTFDRRTFNFAGTCSYILAHDVVDKNFTVTIDYEEGVKKSITVLSNGKQIKLFNDFRVTIDGAQTDLPYQHLNTTVIRLGNQVRLHNSLGFTALCDNLNDVCTFNISGWYFGKTAGLLGIYNNEQFDDFTTSEGRVTKNVVEFARSWQSDSSCVTSENLVKPYIEGKKVRACQRLFQDKKSRFRPCFKQVNPLPFYKKCISETSDVTDEDKKSGKICQIAAAYVKICKTKRVSIRPPKRCVKCDAINGQVKIEGQQTRIEGTLGSEFKSADIVFIVEEKQCNKMKAEKLQGLANAIETSLGAKGLRRNRYALVGFGGNGVHNVEHTHTLQTQLFGDVYKFSRATRDLDFTEDGDNTEMMGAVNFAAKYPFRAGVRKIVILMPCSECENQKTSFAELQQVLEEKDITLHLMMENAFRLRSVSKPYNIYGIDSQSVYTSKDIKQNPLRGNPQLYSQTYIPKDICVALAMERNGSVFNSMKLIQGRREEQKYFIDVLSRRIAATTDAPACQLCECLSDSVGGGRSVCRDCSLQKFTPFYKLLPPTAHLLGYRGENPTIRLPESDFGIDFERYQQINN